MLEHRLKGCFWAFALILISANTCLYLIWVGFESSFSYFKLTDPVRSFLYLIAVPFAFAYSAPRIRRIFAKLTPPNFWTAIRVSFRFTFLLTVCYAFIYLFLKDIYVSRLFLISYLILTFFVNVFIFRYGPRAVEKMLFPQSSELNAVIFAYGAVPQDLLNYVQDIRAKGINFIGYYSDRKINYPGLLWLGKPEELFTKEQLGKRLPIDIVYAYSVDLYDMAFRKTIDDCLAEGTRVQIYSSLSQAFSDPVTIINDGSMQFIGFYEEPLQNPLNRYLKRLLDLAIAIPVCLVILPPLIILIAIVQQFQSRGPIIYRQTRYGLNREPFKIFKLRTMHAENRASGDETIQAHKNDPRVYPFGNFLRRTSLDEFPQFINVLKGEMSVVGPRPHLTQHDDEFEKAFRRYRSRHFVKPGITGLAQIKGYRGEVAHTGAIEGRIQHDLHYIGHWSLQEDLFIIAITTYQMLFPPKTAY